MLWRNFLHAILICAGLLTARGAEVRFTVDLSAGWSVTFSLHPARSGPTPTPPPPSPPATGSRRRRLFQAVDVLGNLRLQLSDFVQRPFRQQRKVSRVLGQDVTPQRIKTMIQPLDLLD